MSDSRWGRVGEIQIAPVLDGHVELPPASLLPGADWDSHREFIDPDGLIRLSVGGFIVRTGDRVVLVDAGLGDPMEPAPPIFRCGRLPAELRALGLTPEDVDTVVCTHLHRDHAGWLVNRGRSFFPNAMVYFGAADWDTLIAGPDALSVGDELRAGMHMLMSMGRLAPITRDGEGVAPGVTTRAAPGHTAGHQLVVISSGEDRLTILGDTIACPLQVTETDLEISADVDPEQARRTRETIMRELEGARVTGPHFPDLKLGRIVRGKGRRYYAAG